MQARRALMLANALTLVRLPLALALACVIDRPAWALVIVAVAAATDAADGPLSRWARRHGAVGDAGAWLDPAADKVFVAIALVAVVARTGAWLPVLLIGARELVLVPLALAYRLWPRRTLRFQAGVVGKLATDAQLVAVGVLVAVPDHVLPFAIAAAAVGLAAVADYVRRAIHGVHASATGSAAGRDTREPSPS
jgi:cardiolipin synthase